MKVGEYWFPYWGALLVKTVIPNSLKDKLLTEGNKIRQKSITTSDYDMRPSLAGMIENELEFKDYEDWFLPEFFPLLDIYWEQWKDGWQTPDIKSPFEITRSNLWINYQKCNEFNPRHGHKGDLSFVIYLKIPEELVEENKKTKAIHGNAGTGTIVFHHGEALPFSRITHEELPNECDIFIFPAWLQHSVPPFFSDVERISVSGNIHLGVNNNI